MEYKGILLDLDNTLYEYLLPHTNALDKIFTICNKKYNISIEETKNAYSVAREKVHIELSETAASHNRLLYFQTMLEILGVNPLIYGLELYNIYWNTFLDEIKLFDGVIELFEKYKGKICFVTDLTAHIQYRKIKKLGLDKYIEYSVTSEEAGREKPHPYIFIKALQKLNLFPKDVCMIGDSFQKDIIGASNLGIYSFWLNHEQSFQTLNKKLVREVISFKEIIQYL